MKKNLLLNNLEIIGALLVGLLFFVWSIPHTSTIRITFFILSLFLAVYLCAKQGCLSFKRLRELRLPFILYIVFTLWIFFVALFISDKTLRSLSEINGQWLRGAMALAIGALFAFLPQKSVLSTRKRILFFIFWVLVIHTLLIVLHGVYEMWQFSGVFIENLTFRTRFIGGLSRGPVEAGCLIDILLSIVLVEIVFRIAFRRQFLPVNKAILAFVFCLALFGSYLTGFRNFLELSALLFLAFSIVNFAKEGNKRKSLTFIALIAVVFSLNIFIFYSDARWQDIRETIPLAFDTEEYRGWRYGHKQDLPKLSSGKTVNISNYIRLAQIKEGYLLVAENPWGLGFARDVFRHAMKKAYGLNAGSHSDSGLFDLLIGTGIPGLMLWLAILLSLIIISLKRFLTNKNYYALVLFFLCISFSIRMIIDPIIRDHKLHQFLFLVGLLSVSMLIEGEPDSGRVLEGEVSSKDDE